MTHAVAAVLLAFAACACSFGRRELPVDPPPLLDLEEPLDRRDEPADEDARRALPPGSFTGLVVRAAGDSLDALADEGGSLEVAEVVENSPADLAGVEPGDLVLEVRAGGAASVPQWPSAWREIELASPPGATIEVVCDRAGIERTARIETVRRARPAAREPAERFREEERAGIVLRTPTEVEARAAGLPPGAGAVVVGLSRQSPWRAAGIVFGDLVVEAGGERVQHPQVLLDVLRRAEPGDAIELVVARGVERRTVEVEVARRAGEMRSISVPFLLSYESDRGRTETSILFGIFLREATPAAWRVRLLWFVEFSGGDADRLDVEVPTRSADGEGAR